MNTEDHQDFTPEFKEAYTRELLLAISAKDSTIIAVAIYEPGKEDLLEAIDTSRNVKMVWTINSYHHSADGVAEAVVKYFHNLRLK